MSYLQKLSEIITDSRESSCVFEIELGNFNDPDHNIFNYGIEEDLIKQIIEKIIDLYNKPHYYRSTTLFHNGFELTKYGKHRCYQRKSHEVYSLINPITEEFDLKINKITKNKVPVSKFPIESSYQRLETTENATFEVDSNIKIIISHQVDSTTDVYKKVYYGIKIVYLHQSRNSNLSNTLEKINRVISQLFTISVRS